MVVGSARVDTRHSTLSCLESKGRDLVGRGTQPNLRQGMDWGCRPSCERSPCERDPAENSWGKKLRAIRHSSQVNICSSGLYGIRRTGFARSRSYRISYSHIRKSTKHPVFDFDQPSYAPPSRLRPLSVASIKAIQRPTLGR